MLSPEEIEILAEYYEEGYVMTRDERHDELFGIRECRSHFCYSDYTARDYYYDSYADFVEYQETREESKCTKISCTKGGLRLAASFLFRDYLRSKDELILIE